MTDSNAKTARPVGRIHIAHCIHGLGLGGAQQVVRYLVASGNKKRFRHSVYASAGGVFRDQVEAAGAEVTIIPRRFPKFDPFWLARMMRRFKNDGIDLVHTHLFGDTLHGYLAAGMADNLPVVVTLHNTVENFSAIQLRAYKYMLPRAAAVVACSESSRKSFVEFLDDGERIVRGISNGLDPSAVQHVENDTAASLRTELGIPADARVIGALGRLVAQKGFADLLDAFRRLLEISGDERLHLVLVGHGDLADDLRRQSRELGITDRVTFTGLRSDAQKIMSLFDVLVFSSLYEGLPVTLLEGMALERPIVATDVPGLRDVLRDGENARLAQPGAPESLARALADVLGSPQLAERIAATAKQQFLAEYTAERMASRYEALYDETLSASA